MPSGHVLIDREEIRRWAESRKAKPACVRRTGGKGDVGMIRLDFPGFSGGRSLAPVSWDQWFDAFERSNLALIVQDTTTGGQRSNFNKLVSRDSVAESVQPARRRTPRRPAGRKRAASRRAPAATGRKTTSRKASSASKTAARKTASRKGAARKTPARKSTRSRR
jgi:hypothetical protein